MNKKTKDKQKQMSKENENGHIDSQTYPLTTSSTREASPKTTGPRCRWITNHVKLIVLNHFPDLCNLWSEEIAVHRSRFQWESISYNFRQWMEILMGQQNENKNDEAET